MGLVEHRQRYAEAVIGLLRARHRLEHQIDRRALASIARWPW
jgi:hypothetical protein